MLIITFLVIFFAEMAVGTAARWAEVSGNESLSWVLAEIYRFLGFTKLVLIANFVLGIITAYIGTALGV